MRSLPPLRWREEKIAQWRSVALEWQARAQKAQKAGAQQAHAKDSDPPDEGPQVTEAVRKRGAGEARGRKPSRKDGRAPERTSPSKAFGPGGRGVYRRTARASLADAGFPGTAGASQADPRAYPSYERNLILARRQLGTVDRLAPRGFTHPTARLRRQLPIAALALSYGLRQPRILAVWGATREPDLSELPEEFVLRANEGRGRQRPLPLRRSSQQPDRFRTTDQYQVEFSTDDLLQYLGRTGGSVGPWFAQQAWSSMDWDTPDARGPAAGSSGEVRLYTFYGEVGLAIVKNGPSSRDAPAPGRASLDGPGLASYRALDGQGRDVQLYPGQVGDASVPLPAEWPRMVRSAQNLSRAVPLPFVRLDVKVHSAGITLHDLAVAPTEEEGFRALEDARLGALWEAAQARLEWDLTRGTRPFDVVAGKRAVPELLAPHLPPASVALRSGHRSRRAASSLATPGRS